MAKTTTTGGDPLRFVVQGVGYTSSQFVNEERAMLRLLVREFLIEFGCELVDVGGLAKSLHLKGRGLDVDARMLTQLLQHLENHREFLLGKHADLKIEMRAALGLASHAILTDEHENGEENALRGDEKRENAERERVKSFYVWN